MKKSLLFLYAIMLLALSGVCFADNPAKKPKPKDTASKEEEGGKDRYKKWLEQDVVYLITDEEKDTFRKLTTDAERDQFIEQFWLRRDPDPRTPFNEYKEEYYRRLAYVNENFTSGIPGWKTDRGMIYLKYGPPSHIEDYVYGSGYDRPYWEGSGKTKVFPTQFWEYRHIDGIGDDIELEFVDTGVNNLYTLQTDVNRKDILLHADTQGKTLSEQYEKSWTIERAENRYQGGDTMDGMMKQRAKDRPFDKYALIANMTKAPEIKYQDLKGLVTTTIKYDMFPFEVRADYVKISEQQVLVPITMRVHNRDIAFKDDKLGMLKGRVNFYGMVTSMSGKFIQEFEDDINREIKANDLPQVRTETSRYQKFLLLSSGKYKLTLVVKDTNTGKMGTMDLMLDVPVFQRDSLNGSSLILTGSIQKIKDPSNDIGPFVLGDLKVVPDFDHKFDPTDSMWVYLQVYNMGIDQTRLEPQVNVQYIVEKDGAPYYRYQDLNGSTFKFVSGDRLVITGKLPIKKFQPGKYLLKIKVQDIITGKVLERTEQFQIVSS